MQTILLANRFELKRDEEAEMKVMIDPGHGGIDPGAVHLAIREADLNLKLALQLRRELDNQGIESVLTRETDRDLTLAKRCEIENEVKPDAFISIHHNSASDPNAKGWEIFYFSDKGRELAECISERLKTISDLTGRGIKHESKSQHSSLYVLHHTIAQACLIEAGFITNFFECTFLQSLDGREKIAQAIARGVRDFLV